MEAFKIIFTGSPPPPSLCLNPQGRLGPIWYKYDGVSAGTSPSVFHLRVSVPDDVRKSLVWKCEKILESPIVLAVEGKYIFLSFPRYFGFSLF